MQSRRHALGQNFLHHKPTIEKIIVNFVELLKENSQIKHVVEVGPGKLAITKPLQEVCEKEQIPLFLIEKDKSLEPHISSELSKSTTLYFMDAAGEDFFNLVNSFDSKSKTCVVSNLPYSAASQIIANLCHLSTKLSSCLLMTQKEMADRIAAQAGSSERGSLSLLVQSYFDVEILFDVKPACFSPPPKVMSTVFALKPLAQPKTTGLKNPLGFEHFCKMLFSKRRKMIRGIIPKKLQERFSDLKISGTERPEELELDVVLALYKESLNS